MNGLILNMAKYGLFLRVLKDPIVQFVILLRGPQNYSNYNKLFTFSPNTSSGLAHFGNKNTKTRKTLA